MKWATFKKIITPTTPTTTSPPTVETVVAPVQASTSASWPQPQLQPHALGVIRLGIHSPPPSGYENVLMVGCYSIGLLLWQRRVFSKARGNLKVATQMTSSNSESSSGSERSKSLENLANADRALQSTIEMCPQNLLLLLAGGLQMPYFSSVGGLIWIVSRKMHAENYYLGGTERRARDLLVIAFAGQFMLIVAAFRFAWNRVTLTLNGS